MNLQPRSSPARARVPGRHKKLQPASKNGIGTAALILGLCGLGISWVPYVALLGWVAGAIAIVLGVFGLDPVRRGRASNGQEVLVGIGSGAAAVLVGVLTLVVTGLGDSEQRTEGSAIQGGSEAEVSESEPDQKTEAELEATPGIGDGTWSVGTEIRPGMYVSWAEDDDRGCYVARLEGFSGGGDDLIANGSFDGRGRIAIAESDVGVEFSGGCEWVPVDEADPVEPADTIGPGVWEVGTEVVPGVYATRVEEPGGHCYVERLAGFSMDSDDRLANDILDEGERGRIEVAETDAGVNFSGDCRWTVE